MPTDRPAKKRRRNWNPSNLLQKKMLKLCSATRKGNQAALAELKSLLDSSPEANRILASIAITAGSGQAGGKFRYKKRNIGWISIVQGGSPGQGGRK